MYRILTEDVNRETIYSILDSYVDGYTVTQSIGSWRGVRENSLAIDLLAGEAIVQSIAVDIRTANKQESVLVLFFDAQHKFFTVPLAA